MSMIKNEYAKQEKSHELPVEIILFHMVDYSCIGSLPLNWDCTKILKIACLNVLEQMFGTYLVTVELFMPRHKEFQSTLEKELSEMKNNKWRTCLDSDPRLKSANENLVSRQKH